jgi:F0F1-type ATP synthase membrane subunit a
MTRPLASVRITTCAISAGRKSTMLEENARVQNSMKLSLESIDGVVAKNSHSEKKKVIQLNNNSKHER